MMEKIIDAIKWVAVIIFWILIIGAPTAVLVGGLVTVWQSEYHSVWIKIFFSGLLTILVGVVVVGIANILDAL